jgi:hypothetical protein
LPDAITLPDVVTTAKAPSPPAVSALQTPYAVRKIDLTFTLGTGDFGAVGQNQLIVTGLRVHAHLQAVVFPMMTSIAILRVYGMTLDHMNQISVAGLLWQGRQNYVQVRAGDDVSGMTTVANNLIIEAYPKFDGGADDRHFYVFAQGAGGAIQLKPVPPTSYPGSVPASQVLQTLASQIGWTLDNKGVNAVLQTPYLPGTVWQQIKAAVRAADCFAYMDSVNKVLIVWPKTGGTPPAVSVIVSPQNGMINYPMFQKTQIIVRTLFNPSVAVGIPGQSLLVRSELAAADNAKLQINMVTHELATQTDGGPWETIIIGNPI